MIHCCRATVNRVHVKYRYTVARDTPISLAMSFAAIPFSRKLRAFTAAASSTLRGRPPLRPFDAATASPARVRCATEQWTDRYAADYQHPVTRH